MLKAANVSVESYWPGLFAKLAQNRNVDDLVLNAGAAGAAVAVAAPAAAGGGAADAAPAAEEKKVLVFNVFEECSAFDISLFDVSGNQII